jgi:hypothetical protein
MQKPLAPAASGFASGVFSHPFSADAALVFSRPATDESGIRRTHPRSFSRSFACRIDDHDPPATPA